MTVVATVEFDDEIALRETARETNRGHGRFGTGAHHTDLLDAGHQVDNALRHFDFELGWRAEAECSPSLIRDSVNDSRRCVTQYHGTPRPDVIDVAIPVDVGDVGTRPRFEEHGMTPDSSERTDR